MSDLERRLVALRDDVEWPATPDLAAAVETRLAARPAARARGGIPGRLALGWAVALVVLVAAAVLAASPDVRADVARWLGIGGVRIEVVRELPKAGAADDPVLGRRVTAAEARLASGRPAPRAAALGEPDAFFLTDRPPGAVSAVWGGRRPEALLTVFRGDGLAFVKKLVAGDGRLRTLTVAGAPGIWVGARHAVTVAGEDGMGVELAPRLAAPTLIWVRDGLTYRLEADVPVDRALGIARSVG